MFLIMLSTFIIGCNERKQQIRDTLLRFEATTIELPERAIVVKDSSVSIASIPDNSLLKFIIYFGAEGCSDCAITHLVELCGIFDLEKELGNFMPIIIFSPAPEKSEEIRTGIIQKAHPFPIYIDTDCILQKQGIPEDRLFRSFLLGKQGKPVFVGYPLANERMKKLFRKVVDKELSSE